MNIVDIKEIKSLAKKAGLKANLKPKEFKEAFEFFGHLLVLRQATLMIEDIQRINESPLMKMLDKAADTPEHKQYVEELTAQLRQQKGPVTP